MITKQEIDDFISRHSLPKTFVRLINEHYQPLVNWLVHQHHVKRTPVLGISGAQGTGKSTLAEFLKISLEKEYDWRVALLSIDDFYYTKAERTQLSNTVHSLLITRGVPGTHDTRLLRTCIDNLRELGKGDELSIPCFSKAHDERAAFASWPVVTGTVDLIILEGWCIGCMPQTTGELQDPINELEKNHDPFGEWRGFVNRQLQNEYAAVFAELDYLFFLQAPNFQTVFLWRLEQELKLAEQSANKCAGIMDREQLAGFMQHYERLTRASLVSLPTIADIVLVLDENHDCAGRIEKDKT